eukprot:TRINITY_DN7565_c0_g2_i2.p1 TRINITY_DN7565_c0_g2~~TRINITY_DN7565_c0_g2_i2.p1  ORF type:complete len:799 (-),score=98.52 TRINITY_DN7565_c0_g2_i2:236-2632(-)
MSDFDCTYGEEQQASHLEVSVTVVEVHGEVSVTLMDEAPLQSESKGENREKHPSEEAVASKQNSGHELQKVEIHTNDNRTAELAANEEEHGDAVVGRLASEVSLPDVLPTLSLRQRFSGQRVTVMLFFCLNTGLAVSHAIAYLVIPMTADVLDPAKGHGKLMQLLARDSYSEIEDAFNAPQEHAWATTADTRLQISSSLFGIIALINTLKLAAALLRKRALRPPGHKVRLPFPERDPGGNLWNWLKIFARYLWSEAAWQRARAKHGMPLFWLKVNVIDWLVSVLQFVRLLAYGGYDLLRAREVPALADGVVTLQACILAADLVALGVITLIGSLPMVTSMGIMFDIMFLVCPLLTTGNLLNRAAWSMLRNDEAFWFNALLSMKSLLTVTLSLASRDQEACWPRGFRFRRSFHEREESAPAEERGRILHLNTNLTTRKAWVLAMVNALIRLVVAVCLVSWVQNAINTECPALTMHQQWRCAFLTHPLLDTSHCNCRALFFPNIRFQDNCDIDSLEVISQQASTVEIFMGAGVKHCSLSHSLLTKIPDSFFRYTFYFSLIGNTKMTKLPAQLSEASKLQLVSVTFTPLETLPLWLPDRPTLKVVFIKLSPVCSATSDPVVRWALKRDAENNNFRFNCDTALSTSLGNDVPTSNSSNKTDASEYCTAEEKTLLTEDRGSLALMDACHPKRNHSQECRRECDIATLILSNPELQKEPAGGLDAEELAMLKSLFVQHLPEISQSFMACITYVSGCQPFGFVSDSDTLNYWWISTFYKITTGGRSDCKKCPDRLPSLEDPSHDP